MYAINSFQDKIETIIKTYQKNNGENIEAINYKLDNLDESLDHIYQKEESAIKESDVVKLQGHEHTFTARISKDIDNNEKILNNIVN